MKAITIYDVCKIRKGTMVNENSFCVVDERDATSRVEQFDPYLTNEMNNQLGKPDHTLITMQQKQQSPTNTIYRCYFFDGDSLDYCRQHAYVFEQELRSGLLYYHFNEFNSCYTLRLGDVENQEKKAQYQAYQDLFLDLVLNTPSFRLLHLTGSLKISKEGMKN